MKHIKIKSVLALGFAAVLCSSCNDWLTLYPQNKVTEEQFWEDMNDLQGVRHAAYRSFASGSMIERILNWGEVRSDNFRHSEYTNSASWQDYNEIVNGRLDTTITFFDWAGVYTTINYCNKVLQHGEEVLEKDKQFTRSQWNAIKAEMIALRALNYFYLIRAFSDVPLVMQSIDTDEQVKSIPQTPMIEVLDTIIADVKGIESGYAVTNQIDKTDTKTTLTQPAIDAILADMLLWRGSYWEGRDSMDWANSDYREAVFYARKSREYLEKQNKNSENQGYSSSLTDEKDNGTYNLIQNYSDVSSPVTLNFMAFRQIFGTGYSDETIFEMPFEDADKVKDDVLNSFFGIVTSSNKRRFTSNAGDIFLTAQPQCKNNSYTAANNQDIRMVYNCAYNDDSRFDMETNTSVTEVNTNGFIMKWAKLSSYSSPEISEQTQLMKFNLTFSVPDYRNFIIYRKSDVLLIEAEALAALNEQLDEVANIIYELRLRSSQARSELSLSTITTACNTRDKALRQVMNERQLELYAEGKRWFDIVRWAERTQKLYLGQNHNAEWKTFDTFFTGQLKQNCQSRLKTRWSLYNPVYYYEREASGYVLKQNPYWDDDLETN